MKKIDENFDVIIALAENASIPAEQVIKKLSDRLLKNEDGTK